MLVSGRAACTDDHRAVVQAGIKGPPASSEQTPYEARSYPRSHRRPLFQKRVRAGLWQGKAVKLPLRRRSPVRLADRSVIDLFYTTAQWADR